MVRKLCLVFGLCLCLYPCVSRFVGAGETVKISSSYEEQMDDIDCQTLRQQAKEYNEKLAQGIYSSNYQEQLNPLGNGMMGVLHIPSIELELPVFHGTQEEVLNQGIGHVYGTSLPIGGRDTHCVLAGHRGIPEAELFTHLGELKIGDVFRVRILGQTLSYTVCEIQTILPEETEDLEIQKGQDLLTLVTCTPYGINTHRLIVTGERMEEKER